MQRWKMEDGRIEGSEEGIRLEDGSIGRRKKIGRWKSEDGRVKVGRKKMD